MKIIVDNKIPYIQKAIERIADEVVYIPGKDFTPELVRDADALIIRTRTHCNRELLEGSQVYCNCYHRLRSHRYGILPESRHHMGQCSGM